MRFNSGMSTSSGTGQSTDSGQQGFSTTEWDSRQGCPQCLFYSNEIGSQFLDELHDETVAMRIEFTIQIQHLTMLLERAIEVGIQHQLSSNQSSPDQSPIDGSSSESSPETLVQQGANDDAERSPKREKTISPEQDLQRAESSSQSPRGSTSSRRQSEDFDLSENHPLAVSEITSHLPGQWLSIFYDWDDENVLSWLQKIDMTLKTARVHPCWKHPGHAH